MTQRNRSRVRDAWMTIAGFACSQGFLYAVLYGGIAQLSSAQAAPVARLDLVCVVVSAIVGLVLVFFVDRRKPNALFARSLLVLYALLPLVGAAAGALGAAGSLVSVVAGVCMGLPIGVLLCAWGRVMGRFTIDQAVPEVFIGSALGAAVCFVLGAVPFVPAHALLLLLPLVSAVFLGALMDGEGAPAPARLSGPTNTCAPEGAADAAASGRVARPASREGAQSSEALQLSVRILAGTAVYGLAAGLVEAFSAPASEAGASSSLMMLLLVLYCLAALQLFGGKPVVNVRAVLPRRGDAERGKDGGPLDGSYRLAILLMMTGFLLAPVLEGTGLADDVVVLAGYGGISAVLVSLFLVMGRIGARDATSAFARGFAALFAGELAGIVAGNALMLLPVPEAETVVAAFAGAAVLYGFLFLFTERDLQALSLVVEDADTFERAVASIVGSAGLSKREAEILPLALRGRTSERIASEFFISKNTVDTHMRRIYAKCGVHSRQELIDLGERTERTLGARG